MSQLVQISLFDRGSAVKELVSKATNLRPSYKKTGKKGQVKKIVKDAEGNPIVTAQTLTMLPRKSKTKTDLADVTGLEGQALMLFESEARQQLMESGFAHMAKLVASGNYTYKMARSSNRGDFTLGIKLVTGKVRMLTEEEFKKQAEVLGFEVVKKTEPTEAPEAVAPTDETELVVEPKDKAKADKAKAATPAKKKQAATPPATTPVTK